MANTEPDLSHVTQTGFLVTVNGTKQNLVIFAGDRRSNFGGNGIGYNEWVPLSFNGTMHVFNSLSCALILVPTAPLRYTRRGR